ncbi:MAG: hypothetical protein CFE32_15120 [Alphaproteobacteria bacterium PA3]|nr:MAG: hypothetical protein CFE32_15120 [Alphaproteobacteria bacterium PA3]
MNINFLNLVILFSTSLFFSGCFSNRFTNKNQIYYLGADADLRITLKQIPPGWKTCGTRSGVNELLRLCSKKPWSIRVFAITKAEFINWKSDQIAASGFFNMRKEKTIRASPISNYSAIIIDNNKVDVYIRSYGARIDDKRSLVASFPVENIIIGVAVVGTESNTDMDALRDLDIIINNIIHGNHEVIAR